jgi:multidrug resistance efflux pump
MIRTYLIPLLAIGGLVFAMWRIQETNKTIPPAPPAVEPARSDFPSQISGAGIVDPNTENISIGAVVPGVVQQVFVNVSQMVKNGDPLFGIDDRAMRAELGVRKARVAAEKARLQKLIEAPRKEDIPPLEALVAEATADKNQTEYELRRITALYNGGTSNEKELYDTQMAHDAAKARLTAAKARLELLVAGTWGPEIEIARSLVAEQEEAVRQIETELERLVVRAPVDGQLLQVNIRPGEYAQSGMLQTPLMIMGETQTLHIKVDIDENDAWRFDPKAAAEASVRGNPQLKTKLTFVRVEPYVVPKRSLTGDSAERVDTRVLQVRYSFPSSALPVYVGQQMDVFIEASESVLDTAPATSANK